MLLVGRVALSRRRERLRGAHLKEEERARHGGVEERATLPKALVLAQPIACGHEALGDARRRETAKLVSE